jgi:hypothetical protein
MDDSERGDLDAKDDLDVKADPPLELDASRQIGDDEDMDPARPASSGSPARSPTPLRQALPDDQARAQFLNATRREMYDALALFHAHVKGTIALMFSIITAVVAIVGVAINRNTPPQILSLVLNGAPIILILIFPFSIISILVIGRYYKLYVAALFYASQTHREEGIGGHYYFADAEAMREKLSGKISERRLIQRRTYGWPHSWSLYALLIFFIGLSALGLALLLWI